jgi:hypothetical protein
VVCFLKCLRASDCDEANHCTGVVENQSAVHRDQQRGNYVYQKSTNGVQHQTGSEVSARKLDCEDVVYRARTESLSRNSVPDKDTQSRCDDRVNEVQSDRVVFRGPITVHIHLGRNGRVSF